MTKPALRARLARSLPILALLLAATATQTGCGSAERAGAPPVMPSAERAPASAPAAEAASAAPAVGAVAQAAPIAGGPTPSMPNAPAPAPAPAKAADAKAAATPAKPAETKTAKNAGPSTRAPVIIYQGDLRMMTDEDAIPKTIDRIVDVAESLGGHIAGRKDQSVQIKVPSASFREAMTKIDAIGGVVSRSVTADDVSEEFHDLEVRLANLRTTRTRLQELMGRASNIADMLTVEKELERVAQEIDRIEGRLEFLRTRAAMSVISIAVTPKPKPSAPVVVAPAAPQPFRAAELPIPWVNEVGIDPLLSLKK